MQHPPPPHPPGPPTAAVEDWDALEAVWQHGMEQLTHSAGDPEKTREAWATRPVLLSEPLHTVPSQRERVCELMFERMGVQALYLARAPALSAFSLGRANAIVVDIGASSTRVSGVLDGYALNRASTRGEGVGAKDLVGRSRHVLGWCRSPPFVPPLFANARISQARRQCRRWGAAS